jgi:hypothetical protein
MNGRYIFFGAFNRAGNISLSPLPPLPALFLCNCSLNFTDEMAAILDF